MDRQENCQVMISDVHFLHLLALLENPHHDEWDKIINKLEEEMKDKQLSDKEKEDKNMKRTFTAVKQDLVND
jgi:hypothetical protein